MLTSSCIGIPLLRADGGRAPDCCRLVVGVRVGLETSLLCEYSDGELIAKPGSGPGPAAVHSLCCCFASSSGNCPPLAQWPPLMPNPVLGSVSLRNVPGMDLGHVQSPVGVPGPESWFCLSSQFPINVPCSEAAGGGTSTNVIGTCVGDCV